MNAAATTGGGCGGGNCQCAGQAQAAVPAINGISLHAPGERLDLDTLSERAWGELLRQEAVRKGLLPRLPALLAPVLTEAEQRAIQAMLDETVPLATPSEEECQRYYEANKQRFVEGRQVHLRHILFAVTAGLDVHALAVRAERALLELTRRDAPSGRFAELARELSNCPSSAEGGDLGWVGPEDCAEELANELFLQKSPLHGMGVHPRLVHSRYGLHIVEVLGRKQGRALAYEQVRERIAMELAQRSRATALHQYVRVLAGQALVEGLDLEGATSPLVQ
jgi:peptidyl-prolyl cis-trans isomerase C